VNRQTAMAGGGEPRGSKLPVRGHIKIGKKGAVRQTRDGKGTWQAPEKLDHFVVTTLERDETGNFRRDDALHKVLAEKGYGERPTVLPIQLIYNDLDLNYSDYLGAWRGKTRWCFSDGCSGVAERLVGDGPNREEVACPCERLTNPNYDKPDKCKPHGRLDCIIEGALTVGGVYRLDTTSWGSCEGLDSSLEFIRRITGGRLAGLPLNLTLSKQTKTNPTTNKPVEVYIVGIEYRGSIEELRLSMLRQLEADQHFFTRIEQIESRIPRDKLHDLDEAEQAEIAEEFHPEAAQQPPAPENGGAPNEQTGGSGSGRRQRRKPDNSASSQLNASETLSDEISPQETSSKDSNDAQAISRDVKQNNDAGAVPRINLDDAF